MNRVHVIKNGSQSENAYLVVDDHHQTILIDPGIDSVAIIDFIQNNNLIPIMILATHGHWDHISAVSELVEYYHIPFYAHPNDQKLIKSANLYRFLVDKLPVVKVPKIDFHLQHMHPITKGSFEITPFLVGSHTSGSVFLLVDNLLFTGDVLLKGKIDEDNKRNNWKQLVEILENIRNLADDIVVYPGHGSQTRLQDEIISFKDLK